jgi:N-acetylglucosaminyldiphosphoundecaprenol N-acetyl-beta-D-mannosaminyltransferase
VLIVGMGMPRQEEWIAAVQHDVPTLAILPAGAYLDYQVGAQRPAPRWMGQVGLE